MNNKIPKLPRILTTTVGSFSEIDWLMTARSEQAIIDATQVVISTQRRLGVDLPTDGELYRYDTDHPDTNGMIEYFIKHLGGININIGRSHSIAFRNKQEMSFRKKPAGIVMSSISEGCLDLFSDCSRSASVADGIFKFTLTSPYMLARTLLDNYYFDLHALTNAIANVIAEQVSDLPCACLQIDEANIPGSPKDTHLASEAINQILDRVPCEKAVHLCFGNYGGQSIQKGDWKELIDFLNRLRCDQLILEMAHRPEQDLEALKNIDSRIAIGIGVVDIKINHIETEDEIARRIEHAEKKLGIGRIRWVHPDCGFWMLKRSVAERKIAALVKGRDKYLGL